MTTPHVSQNDSTEGCCTPENCQHEIHEWAAGNRQIVLCEICGINEALELRFCRDHFHFYMQSGWTRLEFMDRHDSDNCGACMVGTNLSAIGVI